MELKYKMNDEIYLGTHNQIAWPINKNGDSINIGITANINTRTNECRLSFKVYLGITAKDYLFEADNYPDCYDFIVEYTKNIPLLKTFQDWIYMLKPTMTCVELWFRSITNTERLEWMSKEEAIKRMKKYTFVNKREFFDNQENYAPKKYKPRN